MGNVYVVMAEGTLPICFNVPWPAAVFDNRKDAVAYTKAKNAKGRRLNYYIRKAAKEPTP